jgi:spore coat polysaccharide biosynthesis protein SpsF (cytidylyltransferase family)
MNIGAIIQARMTSTRLPGKVLLDIKGIPTIYYLFEQLKQVQKLDKIILATTTNKNDDSLAAYAAKQGVRYFRGSEQDVLERFYMAARHYKILHVMRVTGDCPLLDPEICDRVISTYLNKRVDFVHTGPTFAEGLDCEIFSFQALEEAYHNAKLKSEREHVTLYLHNHAKNFTTVTLENETDDGKYRFTLDEPEDFQVIKAIIEGLSSEKTGSFTAEKVKSFLDQHPDISRLNADIIRNEGLLKSLRDDEVIK